MATMTCSVCSADRHLRSDGFVAECPACGDGEFDARVDEDEQYDPFLDLPEEYWR